MFRRVTLPQVWPVLVGAASLAFALSFDEFIITFFVIGADSTLPLFIWSTLRRTVDPSINAISTLLLLVTLVLFAVSFVLTFRGGERSGGRSAARSGSERRSRSGALGTAVVSVGVPRVRLEEVTHRFGEVTALDGVSLDVHEGEFVTLLGPSGCGKTTLLRIVAGFERPTEGRVILGGDDVTRTPPIAGR